MKRLIKKILRESDFDWTMDIKEYSEEEEFVIDLMDSCEKKGWHGEGFWYEKNGINYFYQNDELKFFWFDWDDVYEVLKSKFNLEYDQQKTLIGGLLESRYNLKGYKITRDYPFG